MPLVKACKFGDTLILRLPDGDSINVMITKYHGSHPFKVAIEAPSSIIIDHVKVQTKPVKSGGLVGTG